MNNSNVSQITKRSIMRHLYCKEYTNRKSIACLINLAYKQYSKCTSIITATILTAFMMHFSLIDWEVYFLFYNDKRLMSHHYSYIINKSGKSGIDQTFMTQMCNSKNARNINSTIHCTI